VLRYEAARNALADFYYEQLFGSAKKSRLSSVPPEQLMEWLSSERAESMRKAESKERRMSFDIDWQSLTSVQDMRKRRSEETVRIVEKLVDRFHLP
jgi:hypothetical protein